MTKFEKKKNYLHCVSFFFFLCALSSSVAASEFSIAGAMNDVVDNFPGDTAYQMLAPSDDTISVASENLSFDFGDTEPSDYSYGFGLHSKMTATYDISNSGPTKTVQMGFPLVTSFADLSLKDIKIMDGEEEISYQAYYGKPFSEYPLDDASRFMHPSDIDDLTLEQALEETITGKSYLDETLLAKVYRFRLDDLTSQTGVLKFEADPAKTTFILDSDVGFMNHDYGQSGYNSITVAKSVSSSVQDDYLSFSVIGEDIQELTAYVSDNMQRNLIPFDDMSQITSEIVNFKDEVAAVCTAKLTQFSTHYGHDSVTEEEISAVFPLDPVDALSLLEYETAYALPLSFGLSFDDLMVSAWSSTRVIMIVFDAELNLGSGNTFTISYAYETGMDSTYDPQIFALNYVSNPGKMWSSFGPLTVTVVPPDDMHVINASITFVKQLDGTYISALTGLPEDNITFLVCAGETPRTSTQRFVDFLHNCLNVFLFVVCYIVPSAIIIMVFIITILHRQNAKKRQIEAPQNGDTKK